MNILDEGNKNLIEDDKFEKIEDNSKKFIGSYNRNLFYLEGMKVSNM